MQVKTADGRESYFQKFQIVSIIFRPNFFKKFAGKGAKTPLFAVLSSDLKQRYFFHAKKKASIAQKIT